MVVERTVLTAIYAIALIVCVWVLPRTKRRETCAAFLACQALTWLNALLHIQYGLLEFPVREFPKATQLSFTLEFFMYPFICALSYVYESKDSWWKRKGQLALWVSGAALIEVLLEKYTELIHYNRYAWYYTWLVFFVAFTISNRYTRWFFKQKKEPNQGGESAIG